MTAARRIAALADADTARKLAYRHSGRFAAEALPLLDTRAGVAKGDQFNYTKKKDGTLSKVSREALPAGDFTALLELVEENLRNMGREIFSGDVRVAPFRKGTLTACDQCDSTITASICDLYRAQTKLRRLRSSKPNSLTGRCERSRHQTIPSTSMRQLRYQTRSRFGQS